MCSNFSVILVHMLVFSLRVVYNCTASKLLQVCNIIITLHTLTVAFSALTLLAGHQEEYLACKK